MDDELYGHASIVRVFIFSITKVDTLYRGLALESMLSVLSATRLPLFLLLWIMCMFIHLEAIRFVDCPSSKCVRGGISN
jgi:hypothetical protein